MYIIYLLESSALQAEPKSLHLVTSALSFSTMNCTISTHPFTVTLAVPQIVQPKVEGFVEHLPWLQHASASCRPVFAAVGSLVPS